METHKPVEIGAVIRSVAFFVLAGFLGGALGAGYGLLTGATEPVGPDGLPLTVAYAVVGVGVGTVLAVAASRRLTREGMQLATLAMGVATLLLLIWLTFQVRTHRQASEGVPGIPVMAPALDEAEPTSRNRRLHLRM